MFPIDNWLLRAATYRISISYHRPLRLIIKCHNLMNETWKENMYSKSLWLYQNSNTLSIFARFQLVISGLHVNPVNHYTMKINCISWRIQLTYHYCNTTTSVCSKLWLSATLNISTVRPRGTQSMCPKKNRVSQNRLSWGLLLFSKVSKFKKNRVPWG